MKNVIKGKGMISLTIAIVVYMALVVSLTLFSLGRSRSIYDDLLANEMIDVARCAASTVDGDVLARITSDEENDAYREVYSALSVYLNHTEAKYIYAMRYEEDKGFYFLVDTDPVDPGLYGENIEETEAMSEVIKGTLGVDERPYEDRWGSFYSAYCPVFASDGTMSGVIGVDFPADWYEREAGAQSIRLLVICVSAVLLSAAIILILVLRAKKETVSEIKERDELQLARAKEWEANRSRNRFLENMSREVRMPIETVLNYDEMLSRESVDPEIIECADQIRHAGNELLSLMDEILDMSRVETDKAEIHPVRYDPVVLISDITEMVKLRVRDKEINIITEIDDKVPRIVLGDSTRIRQCLTNLVTNSVKFTNEGEIHLTVKREKMIGNNVWLKYSVSDTGGGMSEAEINKVREAFRDVSKMGNTSSEGTAMGLTIVQRILESMDTELLIKSVVNKGSTFGFVIKQNVVDDRSIGEYEKAREMMDDQETVGEFEPYTAPEARILLVDDAKMNLKLVTSLLKDTEITVDTTESGAKALELLSEHEYDVLIFDHLMPEIDGIELLRLVRENRSNPNCSKPCMVLTGNTIEGARNEYLRVGFDAYMGKPVKKSLLEGLLLRYIPASKIKRDPFAPKQNGGK